MARPDPALRPSDQAGVRRANLSLVLRHLLTRGPRTRATIAAEVGLTKATVSSLVADLVTRRLVVEGSRLRRGTVGRPGRLLHVAAGSVVGIGANVTNTGIDVVAQDLMGAEVLRHRVQADIRADGAERAVSRLVGALSGVLAGVEGRGRHVAGAVVAVPGLVDVRSGIVAVAPNVGWRDLPLRELVRAGLDRPDVVVAVGNDANLGAVAEHLAGAARGTRDLVYVSGEVGVGAGLVLDGHLVRGAVGFSGEVGHTPLGRPDLVCACGRRGCWETEVGLSALLRAAAHGPDDEILDIALDDRARLRVLDSRIEAGDPAAGAAVRAVGRSLGRGAAVLVNLVNPGALVLGGYFGVLGRHLVPCVVEALDDQAIAPEAGGCEVVASTLGLGAPSIGGAIEALRRVVDDPTTVPVAGPGERPGDRPTRGTEPG
jgi:predicted NBD/HSP70 family sugar kinase